MYSTKNTELSTLESKTNKMATLVSPSSQIKGTFFNHFFRDYS